MGQQHCVNSLQGEVGTNCESIVTSWPRVIVCVLPLLVLLERLLRAGFRRTHLKAAFGEYDFHDVGISWTVTWRQNACNRVLGGPVCPHIDLDWSMIFFEVQSNYRPSYRGRMSTRKPPNCWSHAQLNIYRNWFCWDGLNSRGVPLGDERCSGYVLVIHESFSIEHTLGHINE